ncbi:MAG: aspartate aminotransferase family protein, partial [Firmicutes bacterium]|nr:aspartate aminotransferase family protein [Bacillota bacterium]
MSIAEKERSYIFNTYNRLAGITPYFVKGEGVYLWDDKGKKYLDFLAGLAVNSLGHCYPSVVKAISDQAEKLLHTSNLYYTEPQVTLAQMLVESGAGEKVFFANSGAEANEAAIKLARKHARLKGRENSFTIITALNSFHGRTMATLTATGQKKYQIHFTPTLPGFKYAPFNNLDAFAKMIDETTCAIMVEPLQGEGGVYVAESSFLTGLRELCDRHNLLLIFDEVQCGLGRTGTLFAWQHFGVKPDIITLAKALGGGLPIGAMLARGKAAKAFAPGDHASTFGGNPVTCAAAIAVLREISKPAFLAEVKEKGAQLERGFMALKEKYPAFVKEVRGLG